MKSVVNDFLLMFQFFTRIPINKNLSAGPKNFKVGVFFLPLVGFLIGALQYGIIYICKDFLPSTILAALVTILPIIFTGALHVDGLGDTCDGFFAFTDNRSRRLEIMSDSSSGTFAICAIISDILLQYVAIEYMIQEESIKGILVIIMFSKLFVLFTAMWGSPAKKAGSGNLFIGNMSFLVVLMAVVYTFIIAGLTVSLFASFVLFFSGAVVSYLFYMLSSIRIGGITGDTMGATQEIATVVMLIVYCSII